MKQLPTTLKLLLKHSSKLQVCKWNNWKGHDLWKNLLLQALQISDFAPRKLLFYWTDQILLLSIMTARHGLLCSPLLFYFLISSSTLCRQTKINTYGNIVGRRGLEFSRGFARYIQERSVISIYSSLTRHAFGGFCNSDELWISFARGNLPCERPSFVRVQNTTPEPFVSLWRCGRSTCRCHSGFGPPRGFGPPVHIC